MKEPVNHLAKILHLKCVSLIVLGRDGLAGS